MPLHLVPSVADVAPERSSRLRAIPGPPTAALAAAPDGARVIPLPLERSTFESCVTQALTALDARGPSAAGDLFDLVSRPVYALLLAITGDETAAQEATVEAFAEMWVTCGSRPEGAGTAWVMDIACRSARSRRARQPDLSTTQLRLVPTG